MAHHSKKDDKFPRTFRSPLWRPGMRSIKEKVQQMCGGMDLDGWFRMSVDTESVSEYIKYS
jgi:hypothetical protein